MANGITVEQMADLANQTTERFGRGGLRQIWQTITEFEVLPRIMKKDKIVWSGGDFVRFNLMTGTSDSARMVKLAEKDQVNIPSLSTFGRADWRFATWNWAWERRVALMQRSGHEIVSFIMLQKMGAKASLAELLEQQFFSLPTDPNNDTDLLGIFHWAMPATAVGFGFNGGIPSGFSDVAGLNPNTLTAYKSANAGFSQISDEDSLEKAREACLSIKFKSPVDARDYQMGRGQRYRNYVDKTQFQTMTAIARGQNDNLGGELFAYNGGLTFNSTAVVYIPYLDTISSVTNPWLMLDMDTVKLACLEGDYMTESPATKAPEQHNVVVVHGDLTTALYCEDRRRNCCLNKIAA